MKITAMLVLLTSAMMILGACSTQEEKQPAEDLKKTDEISVEQEETEDEQENSIAVEEKIFVADASMYRGTITKIEEKDESKLVYLKAAEGTNFGAQEIVIKVTEDTKMSFEEEKLCEGAYLEVFYGGEIEEEVEAIGMNIYMPEEMVIFNGIVKEFMPKEDKDGEGRLVMESLDNGEEIIFNYSPETQFYLNVDDLGEESKLNIFHKGIFTRSIPPQGIALEVRTYFELTD